jgi:hypothetical protein
MSVYIEMIDDFMNFAGSFDDINRLFIPCKLIFIHDFISAFHAYKIDIDAVMETFRVYLRLCLKTAKTISLLNPGIIAKFYI